jgi:hypothetical protein
VCLVKLSCKKVNENSLKKCVQKVLGAVSYDENRVVVKKVHFHAE